MKVAFLSVVARLAMTGAGPVDPGLAALEAWLDGGPAPDRGVQRAAVRRASPRWPSSLRGAPWRSVCRPSELSSAWLVPRHTRGTPPNVVETDARTWLALATGRVDWATAVANGALVASGGRAAEIARYLPLGQPRCDEK